VAFALRLAVWHKRKKRGKAWRKALKRRRGAVKKARRAVARVKSAALWALCVGLMRDGGLSVAKAKTHAKRVKSAARHGIAKKRRGIA